MPEIEPKDQSLKALKGIHLWHAPMSSCSQRVRISLAEAGEEYESHLIDLAQGEHASEAYQAIHPNGVVPAIVDDGALIIESIDIIKHVAKDAEALASSVSAEVLERADAAQADLKLLTHEFLFKSGPPKSDEDVRGFQESHHNEALKAFHREFVAGFDDDRIDQAVRRTREGFEFLDDILSDGRSFLSGKEFTLSDIAWMPNFHRMDLMGWPYERTPHLLRWFSQVSQRPSYQKALVDWENQNATRAFAAYTLQRRAEGTDVSSFGGVDD